MTGDFGWCSPPALRLSRHHNLVHTPCRWNFQTTRWIINALLLCLVVGYIEPFPLRMCVCWLPAPCLNRHQLLNPFGSSWGVPDGWGYHKIDCYNLIWTYHMLYIYIYMFQVRGPPPPPPHGHGFPFPPVDVGAAGIVWLPLPPCGCGSRLWMWVLYVVYGLPPSPCGCGCCLRRILSSI